jgi:hypothetical protein
MNFYLPDVQYFCPPVRMSILGQRLYSLTDARKNSGLLRSGYVKPYACDTRVMFLLLTGWSRMNCASGLCRVALKTVLLAGALLPKLSTPCAVAESASGVPFQALHSNEAVRIIVLDPTGALVPDADVTVTCVGRTGATTSHRTNHFGSLLLWHLLRSDYEISVHKQGFAAYRREISLRRGHQLNLRIQLKLPILESVVEIESPMGIINIDDHTDIAPLPFNPLIYSWGGSNWGGSILPGIEVKDRKHRKSKQK